MEYAPGRAIDLYGAPSDPTVLLWHGTQSDARGTVRVLATLLADRGLSVAVPDWDSHSDDRGRSDLLRSVEFARSWSNAPDGMVLVGWSLGGVAAAGLAVHAADHDIVLAHTVCLAGAFMVPDPISGTDVTGSLGDARARSPFTLLHGRADDVVPVAASRSFSDSLTAAGWDVRFLELDADHGNIAGARYDASADRYEPADDPDTERVAAVVAGHIATAAGGTPSAGWNR